MTRAPRRSIELDKASAFQNAIEDGGCQILIVQNLSPLAKRFIGGENHGSFSQVTIVDHVEQDIGSIWTVG
jgi:hypothetical protein